MGLGFGLMYCPAIVIVTIYFEKYRSLATGLWMKLNNRFFNKFVLHFQASQFAVPALVRIR